MHSQAPLSELVSHILLHFPHSVGLRLDPDSFSRSRLSYYTSMAFVPVTDELMLPAPPELCRHAQGIPPGTLINYARWAPDSGHVAFTLRPSDPKGRSPLRLWVLDTQQYQARELLPSSFGLNTVYVRQEERRGGCNVWSGHGLG